MNKREQILKMIQRAKDGQLTDDDLKKLQRQREGKTCLDQGDDNSLIIFPGIEKELSAFFEKWLSLSEFERRRKKEELDNEYQTILERTMKKIDLLTPENQERAMQVVESFKQKLTLKK